MSIKKIGIVAGEASGDLLGKELIVELKKQYPDVHISGLGGPQMIAAGCQSITNYERLSVMGLIEPLFHLHDLLTLRHELLLHFLKEKPDIFIGIDSPDFNLRLEHNLKAAGIPIVHYVSPSVWAWRQNRIQSIAKTVDLMLTLFPFEADFYRAHHVPVTCVGHPLAERIPLSVDKISARQRLGVISEKITIALLPGSRNHEIKKMSPLFIETAKIMWQHNPEIQFITSTVNAAHDQALKSMTSKLAPQLPLQFFQQQSHDVIAAADGVLVTSGTATLECLLFKRPMVIAYRTHALTYHIGKRIVKVPYIGLPNLLAGERLVPEFIQGQATPRALSTALNALLHSLPEEQALLSKRFNELHHLLRQGGSVKAVEAIQRLY